MSHRHSPPGNPFGRLLLAVFIVVLVVLAVAALGGLVRAEEAADGPAWPLSWS